MRNRSVWAIVSVVLMELGLLLPAFANHDDLNFEINEVTKGDIFDFQKNNLTGLPLPSSNEPRLILDSFYSISYNGQGAIPYVPKSLPDLVSGDPSNPNTLTLCRGTGCVGDSPNPNRNSGGLLPDVILPGGGLFYAWYGRWAENVTENGKIDNYAGGQEFVRKSAEVVSYIKPGFHPEFKDNGPYRGDNEFDFKYNPVGRDLYVSDGQNGAGLIVFFYDGSLLRSYTVLTMAGAHAPGDPEQGIDRSCGPTCLEDVDQYAALVPQPLEGVFASTLSQVDPFLPAMGFLTLVGFLPPGVARTIDQVDENVTKVIEFLNETVIAPYVDPLLREVNNQTAEQQRLVSRLYNETLGDTVNDTFNSINGSGEYELNDPGNSMYYIGRDAYNASWHHYFDAHLAYAFNFVAVSLFYGSTPFSNSREGGQAGAPGFSGVTAFLGVWKDLNGNGTPFSFGNSRSDDPRDREPGEFFPFCSAPGTQSGPSSSPPRLSYTLKPDTTWGDFPVLEYVWRLNDTNAAVDVTVKNPLNQSQNLARIRRGGFNGRMYTGSDTIYGSVTCAEVTQGGYYFDILYLFPAGAPAFTLTMGTPAKPAGTIKFHAPGVDVEESFFDRDHYNAWLFPRAPKVPSV